MGYVFDHSVYTSVHFSGSASVAPGSGSMPPAAILCAGSIPSFDEAFAPLPAGYIYTASDAGSGTTHRIDEPSMVIVCRATGDCVVSMGHYTYDWPYPPNSDPVTKADSDSIAVIGDPSITVERLVDGVWQPANSQVRTPYHAMGVPYTFYEGTQVYTKLAPSTPYRDAPGADGSGVRCDDLALVDADITGYDPGQPPHSSNGYGFHWAKGADDHQIRFVLRAGPPPSLPKYDLIGGLLLSDGNIAHPINNLPDPAAQSLAIDVRIYLFANVYRDETITPPPPPTTTAGLYRLSADRTLRRETRLLYNTDTTTAALALRRYRDTVSHGFTAVALGISGYTPGLCCLPDGTLLVARTDGTNILVSRLTDGGGLVADLPSPGAAKLNGDPVRLSTGKVVIPACTANTGTGDGILCIARDAWGSAAWTRVTVVTGIPAQAPQVVASPGRLEYWWIDAGGAIVGKYSLSQGAAGSWKDIP